MKRSTEIDFLRGVAVILVLFRHHWVGIDALQNIGWTGVDLFFVLSGFLVSGLLFAEFKKFGDIRPVYFLIRRGFKIYPLFYASIFLTLIYLLLKKADLSILVPEIFFVQNYFPGFWVHHWSLAVEEHFYILLSVLIFLLVKFGLLRFFVPIAIFVFGLCLGLRILSNLYFPQNDNFAATHLRVDSLFFGVFISYFYHFHFDGLKNFYHRFKYVLALVVPLPLIFAYVLLENRFTRTAGFSILYLSFGALLILTLFSQRFVAALAKMPLYRQIAQVGFYSYSIYLFHFYLPVFVLGYKYARDEPHNFEWRTVASFAAFFAGSIAIGIVSSRIVEIPFLKIRDKYFPRRTS